MSGTCRNTHRTGGLPDMGQIKTFNDFVFSVKNALVKEFPDCQVEIIPVTKNNGVHLQGVNVKP